MESLKATLCAFLAAFFYAINIPISKILLMYVDPMILASLLYLGAGFGVGLTSLISKEEKSERLTKTDFPYVLGMIFLDVVAPILLMLGLRYGSSSNASLLGNFEIVATTFFALAIFHENVSKRLWFAICLITASSALLSFESSESLSFSYGSIFVLLATVCWGLENNCTRSISSKDTYEIVTVKGIFSGVGSFLIALINKEQLPRLQYVFCALLLGFVAYGLSIFLYVRAQNTLGAAKTSAYYAINPFVGAFLSFLFLKERLTWIFFAALILMIAGTVLIIRDTLAHQHAHAHQHTITHTHDGSTHTHTITHTHGHDHFVNEEKHSHHHTPEELEKELALSHNR
ncbi:MAG: DMT family transporter [Oscillospiraceae bacterium]|nr:DMT family transporter [Oscillospiraceae bacterium]